jgi:HEAT repeat protein
MSEKIHIFCCYAHADKEFLVMLNNHLRPLLRRGFIDLWSDTDIGPGTQWETEINTHLEKAHIILLMVSPDFIASEYCFSKELRRAMELHLMGKVRVVPIILRPVYWSVTEFGNLQALPTNAIPIASARWNTRDEAFLDIVEGLRRITEEIIIGGGGPQEGNLSRIQTALSSGTLVTAAVASGNVPPVISHAIQLLDSLNREERRTAIDTLALANHPVARQAMFYALKHVLRDVRFQAVSYLLHDSQAIPVLIEMLYEKDDEIRNRAINALIQRGKGASSALIETMKTGDNRLLEILTNMLQNEDSDLLVEMIDSIKNIDNDHVKEVILKFRENRNIMIRLKAIEAIGERKDKLAISEAIKLLEEIDCIGEHQCIWGNTQEGRRRYCVICGREKADRGRKGEIINSVYIEKKVFKTVKKVFLLFNEEALSECIKLLSCKNRIMRFYGVQLVSNINNEMATSALIKSLQDKDDLTTLHIILTLFERIDEDVLEVLLKLPYKKISLYHLLIIHIIHYQNAKKTLLNKCKILINRMMIYYFLKKFFKEYRRFERHFLWLMIRSSHREIRLTAVNTDRNDHYDYTILGTAQKDNDLEIAKKASKILERIDYLTSH